MKYIELGPFIENEIKNSNRESTGWYSITDIVDKFMLNSSALSIIDSIKEELTDKTKKILSLLEECGIAQSQDTTNTYHDRGIIYVKSNHQENEEENHIRFIQLLIFEDSIMNNNFTAYKYVENWFEHYPNKKISVKGLVKQHSKYNMPMYSESAIRTGIQRIIDKNTLHIETEKDESTGTIYYTHILIHI